MAKVLVWSVSLRQEDIRSLEAFKMWIWRRMMKIPWTQHASNEQILEWWMKVAPWKPLEDQEQCYWMHRCKKMKRVWLITQSWKKKHMTEKLGVNEKEPAFGQKTPTTGHKSRSPGRLMLRPEVRHKFIIFGVRRLSNFKLGTTRSRGPSDRCWPISREPKVS